MPSPIEPAGPPGGWRHRLYAVIFEHDTGGGRAFDVALLAIILASVVVVVLDSVAGIHRRYGIVLYTAEWAFTVLFTVEYLARLAVVRRPVGYARSFFGVVDLVAVLPTYLSLLLPGAQALLTLRAVRLLRVFRVLKLVHFLGEADVLSRAIRASARKIAVFVAVVATIVLSMGAVMHLVEGPANGFDNIPVSIYWAIVTMTTVGFGDIVPQTILGRVLAALLMIIGYAIIAVPTGIMTVELSRAGRPVVTFPCPRCGLGEHAADARFCRRCGEGLGRQDEAPDLM